MAPEFARKERALLRRTRMRSGNGLASPNRASLRCLSAPEHPMLRLPDYCELCAQDRAVYSHERERVAVLDVAVGLALMILRYQNVRSASKESFRCRVVRIVKNVVVS